MKELREYYRPRSAGEAVDIKRELGERALYLAGGSDVLVHRPHDVHALIDIRHTGIDYARDEDGAFVIGGGALLRTAEASAGTLAGGMLRSAIRETAPWLIRNAATVAGNIANASPAADSVPALMALDAQLVLLGPEEETATIEDVLVGPHRTTLGHRLIKDIRILPEAQRRRAAFIKFARSKSDICQVNVAVAFLAEGNVVRDVRIALGAVAPTAIRARRAEAMLEGQSVSGDLLAEVEQAVQAEVSPISDWRASEEYRRRMSGVLVRRAIGQALQNSTDGNGR
jgi:carbon-monoxide dehydrogenase medium subunit